MISEPAHRQKQDPADTHSRRRSPDQGRARPPSRSRRGSARRSQKLLRGRICTTTQNLLMLESGQENYPVQPSRHLPVIPGDVVLAKRNHRFGEASVFPVRLIRGGSCVLLGRLSIHDEKPGNTLVDFDYWKLPALSLPGGFHPVSSSRIVEAHIGRDDNQCLRIISLQQRSDIDPKQEIYAWTIARFGLRETFPAQVLEEAGDFDRARVRKAVSERLRTGDLRSIPFVTIDGEDARDFDDAVFCQTLADGFELCVAVADVAHYVPCDSALDREALKRSSSVYFPGMVLPMLPARLSDDLCSLLPRQLRLAMVCRMRLDRKGRCTEYSFSEAVIKSQARLSYGQVNLWLSGRRSGKGARWSRQIEQNLHSLFELYEVLRQQPRARLNIELSSCSFRLDVNNRPLGLTRSRRGDAEKMIEEMMILTNVASALIITGHRQHPGLYRVHPEPKRESIEELYEAIRENFPDARLSRKARIFNQCLELFAGQDSEFWPLFLVRHLELASYTPQHKSHFGLDLEHYAHFTSPIRRYADLINHRIIKQIISAGRPLYRATELHDLALSINAQIRCNDKAMYYLGDCMKLILCRRCIGRKMNAFVDKLTPFGAFVYLPDLALTAFMHQSNMPDYRYDFSLARFVRLRGRGLAQLACGSEVWVKLLSIDVDRRFLDVVYAESADPRHKVGDTGA